MTGCAENVVDKPGMTLDVLNRVLIKVERFMRETELLADDEKKQT